MAALTCDTSGSLINYNTYGSNYNCYATGATTVDVQVRCDPRVYYNTYCDSNTNAFYQNAYIKVEYPGTQLQGYGIPVAVTDQGITFRFCQDLIGTATASGINITWDGSQFAFETFAEKIRKVLRTRIAAQIYTHAKPLGFTTDLREIRARETLHRVLGDERYKAFIRKGFVSVQAKSGLVYQIYPGHDFTKVYNRGIMVDRYCVVLMGGFPPTDSLIMRYLMLLNNEEQFKSLAIKHGAIQPQEVEMQSHKSLVEVFRELKKAA